MDIYSKTNISGLFLKIMLLTKKINKNERPIEKLIQKKVYQKSYAHREK